MDTSADGADVLVSNVLALLADCLRAGATGVSREVAGQWRIEQLHDRMGMGIAEGAKDDFSPAYGTSIAPTGLDSLVVEDVRQDARFLNLAGETPGISSYIGVQLGDSNGHLVGALFAAYPHVRAVSSDEIALLRLAGHIIGQFWELFAARQSRGSLLQSLASAHDRERSIADTSEHAIWQLAASGETSLVNERMAGLLGYSVGELTGTSLPDHLDEGERAHALEQIASGRLSANARFDACLKRKDGTPLMASIVINPLFFGDSQYAGALVLVTPSAAHSVSME